MKHQYVGDINDYRKYALLRALSAGGSVPIPTPLSGADSVASSNTAPIVYTIGARRASFEAFADLACISPGANGYDEAAWRPVEARRLWTGTRSDRRAI